MSATVPVYGWVFMYWMMSIIVTGNFQFMLTDLSVEVNMLRAVIVGVISTRRRGSCSRERMRSQSCRKLWAICRFISFKNVNTSFDCLPRTTDSRFFALFYSAVYYTVSQKNCATFIFTVTLANVGWFLKFFQCRNQKETAHNKNEKCPTAA